MSLSSKYLMVFYSLMLAALVSGCVNASGITEDGLVEDIGYLGEKLPQVHKNLFTQISEDDFHREITALKAQVPDLSDTETLVGISRILALVGDAHTSLIFRPEGVFPFGFHWFKDGIYLLQTTDEYQQALNSRLIKVNGTDVAEAISALSTVIPHENEAYLKNAATQYLVFPAYLAGLGIISDPNHAEYTFVDQKGQVLTVNAAPIKISSGVQFSSKNEYTPLYNKHRDKYYWYEYLAQERVLYFNYGSCANMEDQSVKSITDEILDQLQVNPIEKLIIDLRTNGGGNSRLLDRFIDQISRNEKINKEGRLFVIVGRRTFSSAILNAISLRNKTKAIFIGEPTGGKPNHFGEVKRFQLPNSGLTVTYSTKYFRQSKEDTPSFLPDILIELGIEDFENNIDPVLEYILAQ